MVNKKLLFALTVLLATTVSVMAAVSGMTSERPGEIMRAKADVPYSVSNSLAKPGNVTGTLDTIQYEANMNTNFGGWTDDYFAEYFVMETDGILHSITFHMSDLPEVTGGGMSVWIFSSNYNWPEISTIDIADSYAGGCHLGYYQTSSGKEAYGEPTEWVKGTINTAASGAIADKIYDPLKEQLVPALGAMTVSLEPTSSSTGYVTLDMDVSGDAYSYTAGETLMVLVRLNGFPDGADGTDYRIGFYSGAYEAEPMPGLKFYAVTANPQGRDGKETTDDWGWHIRSYAWDWRLNVEWTGDRSPVISNVTDDPAYLVTTPITISATVVDDNPSGGASGVASVNLYYSIDGGDFTALPMTASGDVYSADIPGQALGTTVDYYIEATDNNGNVKKTLVYSYYLFKKNYSVLFNYDDETLAVNTADVYYWYGADPDGKYPHDIWQAAYGPISDVLLDGYEIIVHVMGSGPTNQPDDIAAIYKNWLDGASTAQPRRLFISGQDYGYVSGFADTTFAAGTFEKDYLGVETLGTQDVNYDGTVASYQNPYQINAVASNVLTGDYAAFCGDSLALFYYPYYELGFNNWIDNMTPATGAVVDFTDPNQSNAACGIHNEGTNFKTVYWPLDYLCLDFWNKADTATMYYWGLTDVGNLLGNILTYFGDPVGVESKVVNLPKAYSLKQNFPNPFNPTTEIAYTLPEKGMVRLAIYNMLGQKVRTLVAANQDANNYRVTWNGLDDNGLMVPSGIYFYTLNANSFNSTKKMVFVK